MRRSSSVMMKPGPCAVLGLGISLALAAPASALELRYKFKPGERATYRVMIAAGALAQTPVAPEAMKMQFSVDLRMVQKVLSVKAGVADLEWTNASGTMKMTGMGRTQSSKVPREVSRVKLTDRGKLLSHRTQGGKAPAAPADPMGFDRVDPMRALSGLNFPARDLKPGDTWTTESKVDLGNGQSVVMKIASRFVALTTYKGRKCAKIQTVFEMPMDGAGLAGEEDGVAVKSQGKVAGQMTTLFDTVAGQEVYADGSVIMLAKVQMSGATEPAAAVQTLDMNSTMKLNVRQVLLD